MALLPGRLLVLLMAACWLALPAAAQTPDRTQDPDPQVRILAYRQIGDQQSPDSLALLALRLSQEGDPAARLAAQDAMGRLSLGLDDLCAELADNPSPYARAWAAHALGNYPSLTTVQVLMEAADDPDERVRREVYEALGRLGDTLALNTLTRAAVRDPSTELRRVAERAAHQAVTGRDTLSDLPTQLALLSSGDTPERIVAARALGSSDDWRVYEPLLHAASTGPLEVRIASVSALGQLGDRRAVPFLHQLVHDQEGSLRYHAIAAIAHLGDESSPSALMSILSDPDPETRRFAIRALGWIGGEGVLETLSPMLDDSATAVRTEVVQQLRDLEGPGRFEVVLRATRDPTPFLRAEATRVLASLEDPRTEETLIALLDDGDPLVRLTATDALVSRGAVTAVPRLENLVKETRKDDERKLYEQALKTLQGG